MEVHHHSHAHGKKTWKAYAWEFIMLFLAVFCGYLAEYQLEHNIEHRREKEYIHSLIADLKTDQDLISVNMAQLNAGILMMDTLTTLLKNPDDISDHTGELYYLARLAPRLRPLIISTRTFEQLKNSGNFRLIRNMETSNKIMAYYEKFPLVGLLESINETEFTEYKKTAIRIFDPYIFLQMEKNGKIIRTNDNPPLRTTNKEVLTDLSLCAVYLRGTKNGLIDAAADLKKSGEELISYLRAHYSIE